MNTEILKDFLTSMSDSIEKEKIELFRKIIDSSEIKQYENPTEFFYAVLYPWDKFISGFLKSTVKSNPDVEFIWKNSEYINRHFRNLFEKYEGSACCADKSKNIVNSLLKYYNSGEKIEFNYASKYTYHLPKKIFKSQDHIVLFYEGLKSLLYGRPDKYIEALKVMTKVSKKNQTPADAKPVLAEGTGLTKMQWRVNTPQLLKEIIGNNETAILSKPLAIFGRILAEVGDRAAELNDPKLNALMCRLAIYEVADPYNENYDAELTNATIEAGM